MITVDNDNVTKYHKLIT